MYDMMPENDLKNNPCTVRVFVNDMEFACRFFTDREERRIWMNRVSRNLFEISSLYFQLEYQYPELKESNEEIIGDYELKPLEKKKELIAEPEKPIETVKEKIIIEPERQWSKSEMTEHRKKLTVYSNRQWI